MIEDTGSGISEEKKINLFQLFGKAKRSDDYHSTGVGLGLAYCKQTVEHLNGEIFCEKEKALSSISTSMFNLSIMIMD